MRPVATARAAVLGSPIGHSRSPLLHRAAYAALGLTDWSYQAIEVDERGLPALIDSLVADEGDAPWRGLSVTMPGKGAALAYAQASGGQVSSRARLTGAANTLIRRGAHWDAENTDIAGIVASLPSTQGVGLILGAGATAASAALALVDLGADEIVIAARRPEAANEIAAIAGRGAEQASRTISTRVIALDEWPSVQPQLIISTLPASAAAAACQPLTEGATLAGSTLLDVVYDPWPSALAQACTRAQGVVVSGLEMLIHQAVEQVCLFTGIQQRQLIESAMRAAVQEAAPGVGN